VAFNPKEEDKMKRASILTLALLLAAVTGVALAGEKDAKTVEGTLVDAKCFIAGGFKGNDHMGMAKCGTACAKSGLPVGVLTKDDKYLTVAVPAPQVAEIVGETVRATGTVKNNSIIPEKLEVNKNGKWEEVKLAAMM
jgi:hypothetical protein